MYLLIQKIISYQLFMRGNEYLYLYSFCGMGNDGSAIFVDLKNFNEDDFSLTPAEISKRKEDRKIEYSEKSILIKIQS